MKNLRKNKGITLIALIITIIILLILAGVTISLTLGDNGLFKTAEQAAKNYIDAENKEKEDLYNFDNIIKNIVGEKLVDLIKPSDYGKSINYSVTVKNTDKEDVTLTNWKVFYNDGKNVYIILDDYLNKSLIPAETGMKTEGTYQAYWENVSTNTEAVATLTNTSYWSAFARGNGGSTATGSPTNEMFVASWNANPNTNTKTITVCNYASGLTDSTRLYIPHRGGYQDCYGYWLASSFADLTSYVWNIVADGRVSNYNFGDNSCGLRPVVCLNDKATGTVGDSVTID